MEKEKREATGVAGMAAGKGAFRLEVAVVFCAINDHALAVGAEAAGHMIGRDDGSFQPESVWFSAVWEQAELVFSGAPKGQPTIQIPLQHFCTTKWTLHVRFLHKCWA